MKLSNLLSLISVVASVVFSQLLTNSPAQAQIIVKLVDADVTLNGVLAGDYAGRSVIQGDVNGDGFDDVIVGAFGANPDKNRLDAGQTYVVFGSASLSGTFELKTDPDITINGINTGDFSGHYVTTGDVNGDGIDDIIIGAYQADPAGRTTAGQTYVIFGSSTLSGTLELSTDADVTINGAKKNDRSSYSLGTGDINGDGFADILIGAPQASPGGRTVAGKVFVVYGSATLSGTIELSTSANIILNGINPGDWAGDRVNAGDFNGDGFDDIIVGALQADPHGIDRAGQAYVVLGSATLSGTLELSTDAFITMNGITEIDFAGFAVNGGDINGDGIDDIIVSAPYTPNTGRQWIGQVYVFFGSTTLAPGVRELATDPDVTINGIVNLDRIAKFMAVDDINGDGIDDLIIGAQNALDYGGQVYVVYGSPFLSGTLELSSIAGIKINSINKADRAGHGVAGGDVNGDGLGDVIIGANHADPGGRLAAGQAYVVYGFAELVIDITPDASCYAAGGLVSLGLKITNNSPDVKNLKISLSLKDPNGDIIWGPTSSTRNFLPGKTFSTAVPVQLPVNAIDGLYTFDAALVDPNTLETLATDQETFTVPCAP